MRKTKALQVKPLPTWRETFDTNVFGVIEVTQAMLPMLKKAPAARIVNLSSQLGKNRYERWRRANRHISGAKSSVEMALLDETGPTGTFTHLGKTLPW